MPAELTDQRTLSAVVDYLRNTNTGNETSPMWEVVEPSDFQKLVHDVPPLLKHIGRILSDILIVAKDIVENGSSLIQNQREDAEDARLNEKNNKKGDKASSGVTFADVKGAVGNSPLMLLLASGAFLIGNIVGAVEQLAVFIKAALGEGRLGKAVSKFTEIINTKISSVIDFGKDIVGKIVKGVKGTFGKLFAKGTGVFSFVGEIAEFIGKGVKFFTGGGGGLMDDFAKLFSKIGMFFNIGKSFGKAVTKLLGKLALPFTIIMGIWDTIIGAIEGYKTGGVSGAFKGGITGLLNSVIGSLLDLVKDGVSWLLGALGFENAEKFLDSFSFSDLISKMVNAIFEIFSAEKFTKAFEKFNVVGVLGVLLGGILDTVKGAISWIFNLFGADKISAMLDNFSFQDLYDKLFTGIKDMAGDLASSAVDMIKSIASWFKNLPDTITTMAIDFNQVANDFIKSILQNVLPRKDINTAWYSPMNIAAAAIPSEVYEYAGINPDTGEIIPKPNTNEAALQKITPMPNDTASGVSTNPVAGGAPTVINNVSRGGDVHNVSNSNVNQNVNGAAGPIITGSAMGLYAF